VTGSSSDCICRMAFPPTIPLDRSLFLLDPELLEAGLAHWVQAPHGLVASRVVALNGQTIRYSHHRSHGPSALHTVSAYTSESRPVPAQPALDGQSKKPTAIPEIPALLNPAMPLSPSMPSAA